MSRGPERLHPVEARRLVALSVVGFGCLAPGFVRALVVHPSDDVRPVPSCAQAAFRRAGGINCEAGAPLRPREALWMGVLLDLNTVGATALQVVPGIGPALSERIVHDRVLRGRFLRLEDVTRVRGVGPRTLERMRPFVTVRRAAPGGAARGLSPRSRAR